MDAAPQPMKWWFHQHAQGTHFLFESFIIENGVSRFFAYLFIFAICWSERGLTYILERHPLPSLGETGRRGLRWKRIGLRTLVYGVATTLRLWYMLITMYFIIDFFIVVILALTSGQLVTEFLKSTRSSSVYHVPGGEGERGIDGSILHHRDSSSSSGYTSLEYKDTTQNRHIDTVETSSGSTDHNKRRSKHREDIEEEQRLFAVPTDHEEFELTHSARQ
ncbi:hypothetical protein BDA99DRAFT_518749 [Phascolomyces articulosus]|uniref:Copper transporter n=1 Tax=Phascolomyces articulosus TaxID=60185 RepID=A0AAD5K462_9FUNG|nr:hypothetical protein BDA99DRAFT_518749 [Phascolomyces articulosus]